MKIAASAIGVLAVLCLTTSLIAAPAAASTAAVDPESPDTVQLSAAEMAAFVAAEGTDAPTAWSGLLDAPFTVTEEQMRTDPAPMSTPYDSMQSTGPVDPTSTSTVASDAGTTGVSGAWPIYCRMTQDLPHYSRTTALRINTHLVGKCPVTPVTHSLTGSTYRQFWFGWGIQTTATITRAQALLRLAVPVRCNYNEWGTYRTVGRFYSAFSNGWRGVSYKYTASSVQCRP